MSNDKPSRAHNKKEYISKEVEAQKTTVKFSCPVCYTTDELMVWNCGHLICKTCDNQLFKLPSYKCAVCNKKPTTRPIKIYGCWHVFIIKNKTLFFIKFLFNVNKAVYTTKHCFFIKFLLIQQVKNNNLLFNVNKDLFI